MTEPTGISAVDALITVHAAERSQLNATFVVNAAEHTVATVRQADLVAQQAAARRRWTTAKGQLTKARKDGSAEKIAAARQCADDAYQEFTRISDAAIAEMQQLLGARLTSSGELLKQARQTWDAGSAVIDALVRSGSTEPPRDGGR
ncbi:hypothetical protein [Amycolatopsis australiensis]|uniref:Phasin protein n=1 Tax=Amycolatopsis australiensis TaxID=546364 RepID=A0A1K1LPT4_9PSEU|nr:hypothetical protein [Amycolatopsis australiensis]SFW12879.1 hypothetical protein SAMN04489730_0119 [Amycolatopsis australiensis]